MDARIKVLGAYNSYLNQLLYELRDASIQQDRMRFRINLNRIGSIMAYEVSKSLAYQPQAVTTPLGTLEMNLLQEQPVLTSILRAGVPFHEGFLHLFDQADNGFISAYRHTTQGNKFIVKVEYAAVPNLDGRTLLLLDPMIATGKSIVLSYKELLGFGQPSQVFICGVLGSDEGVEYVLRNIPQAHIYVVAVDDELTAKSYIVPGLGDAGDLAFGPK